MMKTTLCILLSLVYLPSVFAQDTVSSLGSSNYRITLSYGISSIDPKDINDHIAISNTLSGSTTKTIKSVPEMAITFSMLPMQDDKIILFRCGYMSIQRSYQLTIPETRDTFLVTGSTTVSIHETYTAYPLSLGVGLSSLNQTSQVSIEFIYGLGYIKEETSFVSSAGQRTSASRSLFSPAIGFRIAGQTTVRISAHMGITLELGYRGLTFDEYEDDVSEEPANIKFSYSGFHGNVGLSIIF
jgi:hypothetical protein